MSKVMDIKGQKFGRLKVLEFAYIKNYSSYWKCQCECGNIKYARGSSLKKGNVRSCGCLQKEMEGNNFRKHNLSNTKLWFKWNSMLGRCYGKKSQSYYLYGGRGIKVCNEWKKDFKKFYDWANANGYKDGLTIDRIDVNGDYEPNNCRWITNYEQSYNKRNTMYAYDGKRKYNVDELSKMYGLEKRLIRDRIRKNYPFKDIIYNGNLRYTDKRYWRKQNKRGKRNARD